MALRQVRSITTSASANPCSMSPRLNLTWEPTLLCLSVFSSLTSTVTWPSASERSISEMGLRASGESSRIASIGSSTCGSSS